MGIKDQLYKVCGEIKASAVKISDSVKSEYKLTQLKNELDEMYLTLGKVRYAELTSTDDSSDETKRLCDEITRLLDEIKVKENKKVNKNICPVCGKEISDDVSFCPFCGAQVAEENKGSEQ